LGSQSLGQAEEAPAVVRELGQVGAVDLLGFGGLADLHQGGTQNVTGGDHPRGRLLFDTPAPVI